MTAPTETEYKLIQRLRQNIRDVVLEEEQQGDMFLVSWIRARENDLIKAEDMFRKFIEWRQKEDIANISDWIPPANYPTAFQEYISGLDNEGRPVVYLPLGQWDVRKVVELGERELYVRYVDRLIAANVKVARESKMATGGHHTQFVIIIDMKDYQIRQIMSPSTVETILETFRRFEANYPETLKTAFVVNAPRIFPMLFAVVKPLLSRRTRNKVQIFNSNMKKWKAALLENMPEKSLPSICRELNEEEDENNEFNSGVLVERRIDAGGKLEVHVLVESADSLLEWEFHTDDYDIGFSILSGLTEVCSYERWDSHVKKVKGSIICQDPGKYTLTFDNSYSRMRSKTVRYSVTVADGEI